MGRRWTNSRVFLPLPVLSVLPPGVPGQRRVAELTPTTHRVAPGRGERHGATPARETSLSTPVATPSAPPSRRRNVLTHLRSPRALPRCSPKIPEDLLSRIPYPSRVGESGNDDCFPHELRPGSHVNAWRSTIDHVVTSRTPCVLRGRFSDVPSRVHSQSGGASSCMSVGCRRAEGHEKTRHIHATIPTALAPLSTEVVTHRFDISQAKFIPSASS